MNKTSTNDYFSQLKQEANLKDSGFEVKLIDNSEKLWTAMNSFYQKQGLVLSEPDVCVGENNNLMFLWDTEDHHLECEILGTAEVEWFYRNRVSEEKWEASTMADVEKVAKALMLFTKNLGLKPRPSRTAFSLILVP